MKSRQGTSSADFSLVPWRWSLHFEKGGINEANLGCRHPPHFEEIEKRFVKKPKVK